MNKISFYRVFHRDSTPFWLRGATSITAPAIARAIHVFAVLLALLIALPAFAGGGSSVFTSKPNDPAAVTVTREDFGAVGDGKADDAPALQAAIDRVEHTTRQGIVFLPDGRYRLGKTVYVWTGIRIIGFGAKRPVLILGHNTPGYQDGEKKYVVHFASDKPVQGKPIADANARTFYSGMSNIDFEIEGGNAAAVAIRFHVAQHSFLSHMDFSLGNARAGLEDIGNQASDLHFHGGKYGIVTGKTSPGWQFLLMDSSFDGQRSAAIRTQEAGLTLIRDRFEHVPVAVQVVPGAVEQLYMRDSLLHDISGTGLSLGETRNFRSQVAVENVVCDGARIFSMDEHDAEVRAPAPIYRVRKFALGLAIGTDGRETGVRTEKELEPLSAMPSLPVSDVPELPAVRAWANAKNLGTKGDGETDDTAALQAAIDAHRAVYLPSGRYRLTSTLKLRPDTILIGLNPITTQLVLQDATPAFYGIGAPVPMVSAPADAQTIVSGIGISTGAINQRATGLLWRAGAKSLVDDVKFIGGHGSVDTDGKWSVTYDADHTSDPNPARVWDAQYPSLWVDGGGGVFRNIWTASTFARAGFVVQHTEVPGTVYQLSSEHHVRNEVQFEDVKNWNVYALQLETEKNEGAEAVVMTLRNTSDISFGNLFIYRVSRVLVPAPVAIATTSAAHINFLNVHSYSGTRFAFDRTIADTVGNLRVAAHNFTSFTLQDSSQSVARLAIPDAFAAPPERLAEGFSNATGLAVDSHGDPYFTDARLQHIFRWSVHDRRLMTVQDAAIAPVVLAFDQDALLAVSSLKAVARISPPDGIPEAVPPAASLAAIKEVILPTGTHTGLREVEDLLQQGSDYQGIAAGGNWLALLQSSQLRHIRIGQETPVTCENDGVTWAVTLHPDRSLSARPQVFRGGSAVVRNVEGNLFLAESQIFIYDRNGMQTGVLELPEKPTSLAFGDPDRKTLFIATRHSLYAAHVKVPGE